MKPCTALVLSGGGFFGAYQAGVWQSLHGRWRPDIVVGASVGALNGWPIAAGCDPDELARLWLDPDVAACFGAGPLIQRAERLCRDYRPSVPFGLVMLRVPSLSTELIREGDVTPRHMLASCSLPVFFRPVKIDRAHYVDGGLIERLPIWAAIEMGATRIVAVDLLPGRQPWWAAAGASVLRRFQPTPRVSNGFEITMIAPDPPLGSLREAKIWKRENVESWIARGKQDADRLFALQ